MSTDKVEVETDVKKKIDTKKAKALLQRELELKQAIETAIKDGKIKYDRKIAEDKTITIQRPFFYLVRKGDLQFHILGTHHGLSFERLPLYVQQEIYYNSKVIFLENAQEKFVEGVSESLWELGKLTPNSKSKFTDLAPALQRPMLSDKEFMSSYGALVDKLELWVLVFLYIIYKMFKAEPERNEGMDAQIEAIGLTNKVTFLGMETAAEVAQTIGLPAMSVAELMDLTLEEEEDDILEQCYPKIWTQIYCSGDETALITFEDIDNKFFGAHDLASSGAASSKVLIERNKIWMRQILQYCEGQKGQKELLPTLMAVGVCHLFKETGILKLLEKEGFTITRVEASSVPEAEPALPMTTDTSIGEGVAITPQFIAERAAAAINAHPLVANVIGVGKPDQSRVPAIK